MVFILLLSIVPLLLPATVLAAAPTTYYYTNPPAPNGDNGWFITNPTILLSVDTTANPEPTTAYYSWDSTDPVSFQQYTGPLAGPGDYEHTLFYYSESTQGVEPLNSQQIKVDTELPWCADYSSQSHSIDTTSSDNTIDMRIFMARDYVSDVEGFSVVWDHSATSTPDTTIDIPGGFNVYFSSDPLTDGTWYSHMRIKDFAGNWSTVYHSGPYIIATPPTPPGAGHYEENDAGITYTGTWNTDSDANASSGASKQSVEVNASAGFAFSGNQVVWVGKKANDMGKTDVYIDSAYVDTIDQYNRNTQYQQAIFDSGTLPEGNHTIELVVTGTKRNKSNGVTVDLDAFNVSSESSPPTEPYRAEETETSSTGTWLTENNGAASGGTSKYSDEITASAEITFDGTQITWVGKKANDMGKADVYIDDVYIDTVDQWSKNAKYQQTLFDSGALSPGTHTLKIVVLHQKRGRSGGYFVDIDAFDITP